MVLEKECLCCYEIFLVNNTDKICYVEEKKIVVEDSFEGIQILLDSRKALNEVKTLVGMGYDVTFVKKVLGTLNEYEIQNRNSL